MDLPLRYPAGVMSKLISRHRFTVHDYERMEDAGILRAEDRVELIYGEIVKMSPIGEPHNAAIDRANRTFVLALREMAIVRVQGSVRLDLHSAPHPDVVILKPRDDFYVKGGAKASDVLLIVEMADTSLKYDRKVKTRLNAEMGIPEYWVADLNGECIWVYSSPEAKGYKLVQQFRRGQILTPQLLPECSIPVDSLLA
jgi:Uma2 family endonuclease